MEMIHLGLKILYSMSLNCKSGLAEIQNNAEVLL